MIGIKDKKWKFLHKIIFCGDLLESPPRGDSTRSPQLMILRRTNDNYAKNLLENLIYCKCFMGKEMFT